MIIKRTPIVKISATKFVLGIKIQRSEQTTKMPKLITTSRKSGSSVLVVRINDVNTTTGITPAAATIWK